MRTPQTAGPLRHPDAMFRPTRFSAALAGGFSAACWPWLWPLVQDPGDAGSVELILGMLLLVALPAHVAVIGLATSRPAGEGADSAAGGALWQRIVAWLLAAVVVAAGLRLTGFSG